MPISLEAKFSDLKTETLAKWREWAFGMADGAASPKPTEVLNAGAILEIATPIAALKEDVDAITAVRDAEARMKRSAESDEARVAPYGGLIAAKQRLLALEAEVKELRGKLHGFGFAHGFARGELSRLKQKNRRVFGDDSEGEK